MQDPRHYEVEHGWKTKWETEKFPLPNWDKIEFEDELEMDWYYVYELDEAKHRQSWHNQFRLVGYKLQLISYGL